MPSDELSVVAALAQSSAPEIREPHLFRFSLRHLFAYSSLAAVLAALLARLDGAWPMVIASSVALAGAHVFGTFVGTRLRDTSRDVQQWKSRPGSLDADEPVALPQPVDLAAFRMPETTPLAFRPEEMRPSRVPLVLGMLLGTVLGAIGLYGIADKQLTLLGLALGGVSCGVMGGWIGILATSFFSISRDAWQHAARNQPRSS